MLWVLEVLVDLFARVTEGATWRDLGRRVALWAVVLAVAYAVYRVAVA